MFFHIDPSNGIAIYDQIARQIKFAIANGALKVGDFIPSVRESAKTLAVNPNTVARAYRQLQSEGIVKGMRGTGMKVSKTAAGLCKEDREELIATRLNSVLDEALRSGISEEKILSKVQREIKRLKRKGSS